MDALRLTRKHLNGRVPLIGFSGSPWTLAAYMVEGHGSKDFRFIKEFIYRNPGDAHALLEKLANAVAQYLSAQIAAGAQAIQIFDTWGGLLTRDAFEEFSLRYIEKIVSETKTDGVPIIVFCKDRGDSLGQIATCGCHVVGLDWTSDIGDARSLIGDRAALQGNLDPTILYTPVNVIRTEVKRILEKFGKSLGHIFNLGHGVLPDTPVEHVKEFVRAVKEESIQYHQ
jgi:uroporphyrinogen decarboxylase